MIYICRLPSSLRWKIRLEAELADLTRRHLKDNQWQGNEAPHFYQTFQHILDKNTALNNLSFSGEPLAVRSNKDDHCTDEE